MAKSAQKKSIKHSVGPETIRGLQLKRQNTKYLFHVKDSPVICEMNKPKKNLERYRILKYVNLLNIN